VAQKWRAVTGKSFLLSCTDSFLRQKSCGIFARWEKPSNTSYPALQRQTQALFISCLLSSQSLLRSWLWLKKTVFRFMILWKLTCGYIS
jgi:hypothetical protein